MRRSDNASMEIEFPGRYILDEARFPEINDRIRNEEDPIHEPPSPVR